MPAQMHLLCIHYIHAPLEICATVYPILGYIGLSACLFAYTHVIISGTTVIESIT